MENKIVIVGSGAFGTAMAQAVSGNFDVINIFGIDKDEISDINTNHRNKKYFNGKLNDNIVATTDSKIFEDADIIMLAIPSQFFSSTLRDVIVPKLTKPAHFVNLSKGMDQIRMQSLSTTIVEIVPANLIKSVLKLSGPSFAVEVLEGQPTKFVLACEDMDSAEHIKSLLETDQIKITTHQSIQGVEYVSVLKNPLAILMGIIDGLGYKMNTTAFMFTEAIEEMERFLEALGLDKSAVWTPAGLGDMFLTGTSKKSRNFSTGFKIGKANKVTKTILSQFSTVEGLKSIEVINSIAEKNNIDMPLFNLLYNLTYKRKEPKQTVERFFRKGK